MQHDDLDREQAICDAIVPYDRMGAFGLCNQPTGLDFLAAARYAWPARIEECRRLRAEVEAARKVTEALLGKVVDGDWITAHRMAADEARALLEGNR